jgi:hypothetical protein
MDDTQTQPNSQAQIDALTVKLQTLSNKHDDLVTQHQNLQNLFSRTNLIDRMYLNKPLVMRNTQLRVEGTDGLKIGTNATDLIAMYGATPLARQAAITPPSGGATVDSNARTAIGTIITALQKFGITL